MKTFYYLQLLLLFFIPVKSASCQASDDFKPFKNAIYLDAGAYPVTASFTANYERLVWINASEGSRLHLRTGYITGGVVFGDAFRGVPLNLTSLFGKGMHQLELSAGVAFCAWAYGTFSQDEDPRFGVFPLVDLGYRLTAKGGFIFRAKLGTGGVGIGLGLAF